MRDSPETRTFPRVGDGLRLVALGRVPRCQRCQRFRAMNTAGAAPGLRVASLPAVPDFCTYQLCAPLATRYESAAVRGSMGGLRIARG